MSRTCNLRNGGFKTKYITGNKNNQMSSADNLKNIKKRLLEDEASSLEGLRNPKLFKRKSQLEEILNILQSGNGEVKDIDIANLNAEVTRLIEDISRERRITNDNEVKRTAVTMEDSEENDEKVEIPLFRVHNTILTTVNNSRPIITYYRVNGNPGRLEESFKMVSGTNKTSIYGVGASYEEY